VIVAEIADKSGSVGSVLSYLNTERPTILLCQANHECKTPFLGAGHKELLLMWLYFMVINLEFDPSGPPTLPYGEIGGPRLVGLTDV
jgi:hypothetical protein